MPRAAPSSQPAIVGVERALVADGPPPCLLLRARLRDDGSGAAWLRRGWRGDEGWLDPYEGPDAWTAGHVPIGSARTYGDGADLTLVTFGNGVAMTLRVARRLPARPVTPAFARAAMGGARGGCGFNPADGRLLRWRKVSHEHPVTEAIELAIAHARGLMGQLPPRPAARSSFRSPHEVLAPQLLYTDRVRPPSPTTPAPTL